LAPEEATDAGRRRPMREGHEEERKILAERLDSVGCVMGRC
jgi:hypothetical protein